MNKLGVSYIVFDGIELLPFAIKQIRNHVDYIHINYQVQSWFGKRLNYDIERVLKDFKSEGIIDGYTKFTEFRVLKSYNKVDILKSKSFERLKRKRSMEHLRGVGCTHFLISDSDEFYIEDEFKKSKNLIYNKNIDISSVKLINYINKPTYRMRKIYHLSVPFISRFKESIFRQDKFPTPVDPTRRLTRDGKYKEFKPKDIKMHHMETVRLDLKSKYESTTRRYLNRNKIDELVEQIEKTDETGCEFKKLLYKKDIVEVDIVNDIFNIDFDYFKKFL